MSLPHILLGLLAEPISGYEIKQQFDTNLKHFWFAELSQLYPALKKLEEQGFATSRAASSAIGPAKKIYQRTEAGREELIQWLSSGPTVAPVRHPYLAQVFFMGSRGNDEGVLQFFEDIKKRIQITVNALRAIEDGWRVEDPRYSDDLPEEDFYKQLTLEAGISVQQAYLEWCETCIKRVKKRSST